MNESLALRTPPARGPNPVSLIDLANGIIESIGKSAQFRPKPTIGPQSRCPPIRWVAACAVTLVLAV